MGLPVNFKGLISGETFLVQKEIICKTGCYWLLQA